MLFAHHEAAKARAREHTMLAQADIADVLRDTPGATAVKANYLVLTTRLPGYAGERLASPEAVGGDYQLELWWRVVAVDFEGLCDLVEAVRQQFVGQTLTVPGRSISPFRSDLDDFESDRAAGLLYQDIYFDATTSRAI